MIKVAQEGQTAKQEKGVQDVRVETNHSARKFYAQRNCEYCVESSRSERDRTSRAVKMKRLICDIRFFCSELAVYLTGATLFLAVLLTRVFAIVLDLITSQEELNGLKTNVSAVGRVIPCARKAIGEHSANSTLLFSAQLLVFQGRGCCRIEQGTAIRGHHAQEPTRR